MKISRFSMRSPMRMAIVCLGAIILIPACKSCNSETAEDKVPDIPVKAEFAKAPPVAKELFLQADGNSQTSVLVMARFDEKDRKRFDKNMLAINLDDQKVVLRDDGQGGDEKKDDGLFTARVKTDVAEFRKELEARNKAQDRVKFGTRFIDRSPVRIPIRPIDIKKIFDGTDPEPVDPVPLGAPAELKDHSLMITNIDVIEDPTRTITNPCTGAGNPNGVWTFGFLMRQMASPNPGSIASDADVSTFVLNWLNIWMTDQTINTGLVPARTAMQTTVIDPWLAKSLAGGAPAGQLDMKFAPFRLLAIVNRIDLRGNTGYSVSNGGEGRFVFGVLDENCNAMRFTCIFEYGINKTSCSSLKAFAQQWYNLKDMTPGTADYNDSLQAITDQFTLCGTNTSKPNQNSLNQLRTNELAIGSPWQLREFNLESTGQLAEVTTKREPQEQFNTKTVADPNTDLLADFVNTNQAIILDDTYDVPLSWSGTAFLSGKADTDGGEFWDGIAGPNPIPTVGYISDDTTRHVFSLNTCSGCHAGETSTGFTHVNPAGLGSSPTLSGFLIGDGASGPFIVGDPAGRPSGSPAQWEFNDLQRRADDLEAFVNTPCRSVFGLLQLLSARPFNPTH